jgi:hypothetical protein
VKHYLCYIHSVGLLEPEVRTIWAADEGAIPESVLENLPDGLPLDGIEAIEVYGENNRAVVRVGALERAPSSPVGRRDLDFYPRWRRIEGALASGPPVRSSHRLHRRRYLIDRICRALRSLHSR